MEGMMGLMSWILEESGQSTAWFLAAGTTTVLLFALLTAWTMRRSAAAERHALWTLALVAVLALPLAALSVPWRWTIPETQPTALLSGFISEAAPPAAPVRPAAPEAAVEAAVIAGAESSGAAVGTAMGVITVQRDVRAAARSIRTGSMNGPALWGPGATRVAVAIWGLVALGLMGHLGIGLVVLSRLGKRASPAPVRLTRIVRRMLGDSPRGVRVAIGDPGQMPMTWGFLRPVVLLPRESLDWSDERLELVLSHELAHVVRADAGTVLIGRLAAALYWFNPLVWVALSRLRAESERAADDRVLRSGARASEYAHHLVEIVSGRSGGFLPATALPMAHRSHFEGRVIAILEADARRETPSWRRLGLLFGALMLVVVGVSGAAPERAVSVEVETPVTAVGGEESPSLLMSASAAGDARSSEAARDNNTTHDSGLEAGTPDVGVAPGSSVRDEGAPAMDGATSDAGMASSGAALTALQEVQDPRSVAALSRVLANDPNPEVRRTAAWALGNIEDVAASPALIRAMREDEDVEVRRTSVWALGQIEDHGAVEALMAALSDSDAEVRATAVWALGQIEDDRAVDALARVLDDADATVRKDAAWALGQIEDAAAVPALNRALNDAEPRVRAQAVWALGQIEDKASVDALARALTTDDNADVRSQAAWALGQIEDAASLDALEQALSDPVAEVRSQAAWAIGQIEPNVAPSNLLNAVDDPDADVRHTALWALFQIEDPAAVPVLVGALQHEDAHTRVKAMRALAAVGTEQSLAEVARLLEDEDPEIRAEAARALGGRVGPNPNPRPRPSPRPRPRPRPQGGES